MLNPNDLYITDVQTGVVDNNGRTKNVLQALCLSKDRECYREVEQQRNNDYQQGNGTNASQGLYEQAIQQSYNPNENSLNLPTKQNRFSRFFSQVRSRFARGKTDSTPIKSQHEQTQKGNSQEKKSWELGPEEKSKIQRETAEIAKKYREQLIQQTQVQQQNQEQANPQMIQGQVPQQPVMDIGGMEL